MNGIRWRRIKEKVGSNGFHFILAYSQIAFLFFIDFFVIIFFFFFEMKRNVLAGIAFRNSSFRVNQIGRGERERKEKKTHWNISFDWFYEVLLLYSFFMCICVCDARNWRIYFMDCVCQRKMDLKIHDAVYHRDNKQLYMPNEKKDTNQPAWGWCGKEKRRKKLEQWQWR